MRGEVDNLFINSPLRYTHANVGIEWKKKTLGGKCNELTVHAEN